MLQAKEVIIEEYEAKRHAKSIAEMWNRSSESWGGDNAYQTEQTVIDEHLNSTELKLFLAVVEGEVVGYCSFSHYREDTGALYIPLLNVRPDYHGRKIGKMLVRRAIEETMKLGWPRLDLYTWPGNTKAVPTYKKSGFFWEKRDDSTHLMNFIPSVLQTGAVKAYFEHIDWYQDSIRELSVQPDGRRENGFDYFTYAWQKSPLSLTMEYERTGRGLRLIETEDYLIRATITGPHKLPFGSSYPVVYEAVNLSGKPLTLQVRGISNPKISFELEESRTVASAEKIEGRFYIHPVDEEQNVNQTHPVVEAELLINGLPAVFKLGVEPKFPVKLKLAAPGRTLYAGEAIELDLTVENEYDTETIVELNWPDDAVLSFAESTLRIEVPAKGRLTVPLQAVIQAYGIWHHQLHITISIDQGEPVALEQELSLVFPGIQAVFGGPTDNGWVISSGRYAAYLDKLSNTLAIYEERHKAFALFHPKFGLPYTNEFKKSTAMQVLYYREGEAMVLEARYTLDHAEGLEYASIVKLYSSGILARHHQLHNTSSAGLDKELYLKESFGMSLDGAVIPYRGEYIDLHQGAHAASPDYWEVNELTENWLFGDDGTTTQGITWSAERKLIRDHWLYAVEHPLGLLTAGAAVETSPLRIAIGTWNSWQGFRSFALSEDGTPELAAIPPLKTILNEGNPFISKGAELRLEEQKKIFLEGELQLSSLGGSIATQQVAVKAEQMLTELSVSLAAIEGAGPDLVTLKLDMDIYEQVQQYMVFPVTGDKVQTRIDDLEHGTVLTADNGVLQIKASSSFAPALFSLQHLGQEWLDTAYPHPQPKSWWNPWTGGLAFSIAGISPLSLLEEPRETAFAELIDNKGNRWTGIRISVPVTNHPKFKGLTMHQYHLLLPGVPILASTVRIEQHTGAPLNPLELISAGYYKTGSDLRDSRGVVKNASGENITYKAGRVQASMDSQNGIIRYGSEEREQQLTFIGHAHPNTVELTVNNHVVFSYVTERMYLRDGAEQFSKPVFHLLSELTVPEQALQDLLTIKFQ